MITLCRSQGPAPTRRRRREAWQRFVPPDGVDPLAGHFGVLEGLEEDRLPPGAAVPRASPPFVEIVTYVREGALGYQDSTGASGVIPAGEFLSMTGGARWRHVETNPSRTDWAHVFRVSLRAPRAGVAAPRREQKRFSAAERRGGWCLIASPDGRSGSLLLHHDACVYSSILEPGFHLVHPLDPGRSAWLQLIEGDLRLGDLSLTGGDGAGFTEERVVSVTARETTEVLLIDLGPTSHRSGGMS